MSILEAIKMWLGQNKVRKQYERVEKSIQQKAEIAAEMSFHEVMTNFYNERVSTIDPHQDWWTFAEARQKQYDHKQDTDRLVAKLLEAEARVTASVAAFKSIQEGADEQPATDAEVG